MKFAVSIELFRRRRLDRASMRTSARPVLLEIFLMMFLSPKEVGGRGDFRNDRIGESPGRLGPFFRLLRRVFLVGRMPVDDRAILRAAILTLPVQGRRIVTLPEDIEQRVVGNDRGIELDPYDFSVPCRVGTDLRVRWAVATSASVPDFRLLDAANLPKDVLDAPKTSCSKSGRFQITGSVKSNCDQSSRARFYLGRGAVRKLFRGCSEDDESVGCHGLA
jgi:hypothetical protein